MRDGRDGWVDFDSGVVGSIGLEGLVLTGNHVEGITMHSSRKRKEKDGTHINIWNNREYSPGTDGIEVVGRVSKRGRAELPRAALRILSQVLGPPRPIQA